MDIAKEAIDRAIKRLRNLPNHAGRPSWDKIVAEELNDVIAQKDNEIERLREELKKPILVGKKQIEALPNSDSYWVYPIRPVSKGDE